MPTEYYQFSNSEFNLARMEIETIQKAFSQNPHLNMEQISEKLGISDRTLSRKISFYNLNLKVLKTGNKNKL